MKTEYGKCISKLRVDKDETLKAMAKKINVSPSYLSAIENGVRKVPEGLIDEIGKIYELDFIACRELLIAAKLANKEISISLAGMTPGFVDFVVLFSERLKNLDHHSIDKIRSVLNCASRNKN